MDTVLRQDLIDVALRATDAYLGIEKHASEKGYATAQDIHDFSFYLSKAHDALDQLGDINNHADYMQNHVQTMIKLAKHDDATLADLPYVHVPRADIGAQAESFNLVQIDEETAKGLSAKAAKSGISLGTLKKVYARGVAAWRTGHRPGTTPQQWGMARVNSYITKGKTYHTADKDLHEESKKKKEDDHLDDNDINDMVKSLQWDDIADTYQKEELYTEEAQEVLDEKLSASARLKKQRDFRRTGAKRNVARGLRLQRVSSPERLKQRAIVAARRLLSKRFLRGRDKSELSPQEKDLLEQRLKRLQQLGVQNTLATRLMPKIRSIEQKRLKHK